MQKIRTEKGSRTPPQVRPPSDEPLIPTDQRATVVAVSLRTGTPKSRTGALGRALDAAFDDVRGAKVVFLPGFDGRWPSRDEEVVGACRDHGAAVLFERRVGDHNAWTAHDAAGASLGVEIRQVFATAAEADEALVDDFLPRCAPGGERTMRLAGVDVGLLCCGESSILHSPRDGETGVRHRPDVGLFLHVGVVFNGAHTNMKRWRELNERFAYLSGGDRLAFYATNNASKTSWSGAVRLYRNGETVADGNERWSEVPGASVRVLHDDDRDGFAAIAFTGDGAHLRT